MNRLKNYLSSRQLAEQFLQSAENTLKRGETETAVAYIIQAVRYQITANNNLQSLAFGVKPKHKGGK